MAFSLRNFQSTVRHPWLRQIARVPYSEGINSLYSPYIYRFRDIEENVEEPSILNPIPTIETIPGNISDFPFTVDLRQAITDITRNERIVVKGVSEISESIQSVPYNSENRYATFHKDDTLTYAPNGTYFRNVLIVRTEVSNPAHPPTALAVQISRVYTDFLPTPAIGDTDAEDPKTIDVIIPIEKNIIGNTNAHKTMWETQGINGTCAAMGVGAILLSKGIVDDQWAVVKAGTLVIGPNGEHLNTPTFTYSDGAMPYVVRLTTQAEVDRYNTEGIEWIGEIQSGVNLVTQGYGDTPSEALAAYRELYPASTVIHPNSSEIRVKIGTKEHFEGVLDDVPEYFERKDDRESIPWTDSFFEHFDQEPRTGYATDFSTIIAELNAGNPVLLRVDGAELRGTAQDPYNTIMDDVDGSNASIQTNGNHIVWLSSIDNSDPDNPKFNIVDSAYPGGIRQYDMRQVVAASEDSEFAYMTIGDTPAILDNEERFENTAKEVYEPAYQEWWKEAYVDAQHYENVDRPEEVEQPSLTNDQVKEITGETDTATAWAALYNIPIRDLAEYPDLVAVLPESFDTVNDYIDNLNEAKTQVYEDFNFDVEAFENLKENLDIE